MSVQIKYCLESGESYGRQGLEGSHRMGGGVSVLSSEVLAHLLIWRC